MAALPRAFVAAALAFAAACGLDEMGTGTVDAVPAEAGSEDVVVPVGDAGVDVADAEMTGFDGSVCFADGGCFAVPAGWSLVALDRAHGDASCPAGFSPAPDAVTGPDAGANACACKCALTAAPTCPTGPVTKEYGTASCNTAGTNFGSAAYVAGTCSTQMGLGAADSYQQLTAPAAVGGSCAGAGAKQANGVDFATSARVCGATAALCGGGTCVAAIGPPYVACISQSGDVPCAAPFDGADRLVAGTGADYACGTCPCTLQVTCGGDVSLYSDSACATFVRNTPADGVCHAGAGGTFNSYKFTPVATPTCSPAGASAATGVALVGTETFCCLR